MGELELNSIELHGKPALALIMTDPSHTGLVYAFVNTDDLADFIRDLTQALGEMKIAGGKA